MPKRLTIISEAAMNQYKYYERPKHLNRICSVGERVKEMLRKASAPPTLFV